MTPRRPDPEEDAGASWGVDPPPATCVHPGCGAEAQIRWGRDLPLCRAHFLEVVHSGGPAAWGAYRARYGAAASQVPLDL